MASPVNEARNELMAALSTLHLGGKYSDLTIVCNSRQWSVHKAIVCSRSGFFDGACSHPFSEATSGVIDLSEDDEDSVEQMIRYFYYLDYLNQNERQASPVFRHRAVSDARRRLPKKLDLSQIQDPLLAQAGVIPTADRPLSPTDSAVTFDSDLAKSKPSRSPSRTTKRRSFTPSESTLQPSTKAVDDSEHVDDHEDYDDYDDNDSCADDDSSLLTHTRVYALAEKYDVPGLKELARAKFEMAMACFYDSPDFAEAIEEVYCSTVDSDRGLRDIVLQAFRSHPQLASTQDVFAVIKHTPTLAFELFKIERGIPI